MEFWRTLFGPHRPRASYRPQTRVTPVTPPNPSPALSQTPIFNFQNLALSSTSYSVGTPSSGTINNALGGSVIVASGLPAGLTINSAARTFAWDGTGSAGSGSLTLYENFPGSAGAPTPHATVISYTITSVASAALQFNVASNSQYLPLISF